MGGCVHIMYVGVVVRVRRQPGRGQILRHAARSARTLNSAASC
jgi:hypothetical protein